MSTGREIIFESLEHYTLFLALFPEQKYKARLASELLAPSEASLDKTMAPRLNFIKSLLTEKETKDAKKFLLTLEQLRLSLIVTHEQVDFCFSILHSTPKNNRLKELLHLYLDSPLKLDLAQSYWDSISLFKGQSTLSNIPTRTFVRAKSSTYLFTEWANAHEALQEEPCSPIEFWELPGGAQNLGQPNPPAKKASATQALSLLAQEIASQQSSEKPQWVAFGGSPHALLFLETKLKSLRVPFDSLFGSKEKSLTQGILIAPFQAPPLSPNHHCWGYLDESFFAAKEEGLLTEAELFSLVTAGFSIPRIKTDRLYLKNMLKEFQKPGRGELFISNQVPAQEFSQIEELATLSHRPSPPPKLALPPKKIKLSATQLDSYAACPAQYLVRHRLKLRPIQSLEEKFSLVFGTAVHSSLEGYFKAPSNDLTTLFKDALESLHPEIQKERSIYFLMLRQFREVARHFLVLEEQLKSDFHFKDNLSLEKSFETEISGHFFSGKIDRIIERQDGSLLLIDYKTGRVDFSPRDISNGHGSQALLYLLSVTAQGGPPCVGVLFYDLKTQELRRGLFRDDMIPKELKKELTRGHALSPEKFLELIELGKSHLISKSQSIEQGQFSATPNSQECSRCEAVTFCRQGLGYV